MAYLQIILIPSSTEWEFLILINLIEYLFHGSCHWSCIWKNHWPCPSLPRFSVILSSKHFIVFFVCVLYWHLWSILNSFLWRVWGLCLDSILCVWLFSSSSIICVTFAPLSKINWLHSWGSIPGLSIWLHWSGTVRSPVADCFDYDSFIASLEVE